MKKNSFTASRDEALHGPIRPQLIHLAVPLLFGNILQQCYNIVDSLIIGRTLGVEAFAAVGIAGTVMTLMVFIMTGCCNGLATIFAMLYGKGDMESFRRESFTTVVFGGLFAVFVSVICVLGVKPILYLIATPAELMEMVTKYLMVIAGGMIGIYYYNLFSCILRSVGDTGAALYVLMLSVIVNVVMDFILIVFAGMGVSGAAYATVISQVVAAVGCYIYLRKKYPDLLFGRKEVGLHKDLLGKSANFALSSAIGSSTLYIGKVLVQGSVNALGTNGIAAFAAASRLEGFTNTFSVSSGSSVNILVSQNYGAGENKRVGKIWKEGFKMNVVVTMTAAILMAVLAVPGLSLFIDKSNTIALSEGRSYLIVVACFYILCTYVDCAGGTVRGLGMNVAAMIGAFMNIGPRVLLAPYFTQHWSLAGLGYATGISWLSIGLWQTFNILYKNHKQAKGKKFFKEKE